MAAVAPQQVRILVVDDDPSIRALVVTALKRNGFAVESAVDGVEALARLDAEPFDLLVLDLMMPRLDGLGVVEHLGRSDRPNLPKVMIMTAALPSVFSKLPQDRVAAIVNKPFDLHELISSAKQLSAPDPKE